MEIFEGVISENQNAPLEVHFDFQKLRPQKSPLFYQSLR